MAWRWTTALTSTLLIRLLKRSSAAAWHLPVDTDSVHYRGEMFPGDMNECYYKNGVGFSQLKPDISTTARDLYHCQALCRELAPCVIFRFDPLCSTNGRCKDCGLYKELPTDMTQLAGSGIISGPPRWPEYCDQSKFLVRAQFTFGAPSGTYPPLSNPGGACIGGMRIITENRPLPGGGMGTQYDGAPMLLAYEHPLIALLDLREPSERSHYHKCPGNPLVPSNGHAAVYQDWLLHSIQNIYAPRLTSINVSEEFRDVASRLLDFLPFVSRMAFMAYWKDAADVERGLTKWTDWNLVAYAAVHGVGDDIDRVLVMQHKTALECTIMFEGSMQIPDFFSFWQVGGTGYCGFMNSCIGMRNELWWITNDSQYHDIIKPALRQCKAVTCVGHSLGGVVCDLFTACANSGRRGDPDYELLSWEPQPLVGGPMPLFDFRLFNKSEAEWAARHAAPLAPGAPAPAAGQTAPAAAKPQADAEAGLADKDARTGAAVLGGAAPAGQSRLPWLMGACAAGVLGLGAASLLALALFRHARGAGAASDSDANGCTGAGTDSCSDSEGPGA